MILSQKQAEILRAIATYYVLVRRQVQRIVHPNHRSGRRTREELLQLSRSRMLSKTNVQVPYIGSAAGSPCYYLNDSGRQAVAEHFEDDNLLLASTRPPRSDRLFHWIAISENHLRTRLALKEESEVELVSWINEWQRFRATPDEPETFFLHHVFREDPPLSVSPDAAMSLEMNGIRRAFYWEIDRGTSSIPQVAASKWQGYERLAERRLHQTRHFAGISEPLKILVVTTSSWRRDRLAKAFSKHSGADRYLLCSQEDLQPSTFLRGPIFVDCEGTVKSILKPTTVLQPTISDNSSEEVSS